ncbi:DUF2621 domain-containing protein [Halobacillus sp. A5]|uniref:DUF2621 domain-containing protein n=1 Tax=Halobacillus sp. A5 TaxID=2880263 RepID=UPI0020A6AD7B|nr:DUF2621 domain-containing protein [Halobacillus sp. A5]MCP3025977.1 DUF2621 domain-containing protein [Halobacillus sp. A5]
MSGGFALFIIGWIVLMIVLMSIGGFFMFRKFLKRMPKEDGKSTMDWEEYYVEQTAHMWTKDQKALLEELVSPVPEIFRDVAKQKIAGKIGQVAVERKSSKMTEDIIIEGYILATPKRDHKFLIKKLKEKQIDITPYQPLFER